MAQPPLRHVMRWLVAVEDDPRRAHLLHGGWALIQAAVEDEVIEHTDPDGFALVMLTLHEQQMIFIDYHPLTIDQGPGQWRGQPSYHLQQIMGWQTKTAGREWVRDQPAPSTTMNFAGPVGQVAGRDITNNMTLVMVIEQLEQAVDAVDAPPAAKEEAKGLLRKLRGAARGGGKVAQETGTEVLAKVIAQALNVPPT